MFGDDPDRLIGVDILSPLFSRQLFNVGNDRTKGVSFVNIRDTLEHGEHSFEAHACIDVLRGQNGVVAF